MSDLEFKPIHKFFKITISSINYAKDTISDKSHFFLSCVKIVEHIIENSTITPLKSRIDAILKLQPRSNKKKIQEILGMLSFTNS